MVRRGCAGANLVLLGVRDYEQLQDGSCHMLSNTLLVQGHSRRGIPFDTLEVFIQPGSD